MLNASGSVIGKVANLGTDLPVGMAFLGQLEILFQDSTNFGRLHIRRYTPDLSTILFDTSFFAGNNPRIGGLAIDSAGITYVWGSVMAANLVPYHATHSCPLPAGSLGPPPGIFLGSFGDDGKELQLTYLDAPLSFLATGPIQFDSSGASLLSVGGIYDLQILRLGPAASEVALSCIGNGASFDNMPVAPNEIVSLFGTAIGPVQPAYARPDEQGRFPVQLGGTQVTFDGIPAPLLYAASSQVNLVTPHSLAGKTATHVCVVFNGAQTNCIDIPVQSAAPGIFSSGLLFGGAEPYAAAVNQDGTINSPQNPAPAGSVVSLFVTGLGTVTPSLPDGAITPYPPPKQDLTASVLFQWNGLNPGDFFETAGTVLYAGPAPLEVEGLGQINVQLPGASGNVSGPFINITGSSSTVTLWTK